ncbi:V-set and immunoglobulin domain-containing protein 10 [Tachysurus ichikawai]
MKTSGITFLPFLLLYQTALADEEDVTVIRELGENVMLQCPDLPFNKTPSLTRWKKNQVVLATHNHSQPQSMQHVGHISILNNSSLNIAGLMKIDLAVYVCETEPPFDTHHKVQLLVTGTLERGCTKYPTYAVQSCRQS